jgi:hypothetical protein
MRILLINKDSLIVENVVEAKDLENAIKLFGANFICKEGNQVSEIGYIFDPNNNTYSPPN